MDDDNNNLTIDTSSPLTEQNEKLFSSMSTNLPEIDENVVINKEDEQNTGPIEENSSHLSNLDHDKAQSPIVQSHSPETIISTILDTILTQIEFNDDDNNNNNQLNSLSIVEDDQLEVEEDDDDDDENEEEDDDEESQENPEKNSSNKLNKIEKEQSTTKSLVKNDSKPTTRTLRSHARKKITLSTLNQTLANANNNNNRRVSSRRRALENKIFLATHEKEKKRKSISERLKKDKDNISTNDDNHTSSNSDDQINETTNGRNILDIEIFHYSFFFLCFF